GHHGLVSPAADAAARPGSEHPTTPQGPAGAPGACGAAQPALPPGYEYLGVLGRGGVGGGYRARQAALERGGALQRVRWGGGGRAEEARRFRTEALAVARLRHPNVVQVFDLGEHDGQLYYSMEHVEGGSLARLLQQGPLPFRTAAELVRQLALGVQSA